MAPYTIAHLKLSQYLKDRGHELEDDERFQVYLTNTLEPIDPQKNWILPALTAETKAAQAVKEKSILVITGNPPYYARSKNRGEWITSAIEEYKYVDGRHFGERKHWLHDDYVKFIRFAQMKMDKVGEGIVGIISNHSFLDNPTFRGMRQSLMRTFDRIYVLDLHGNAKKKERTPEGDKDDNVFDIEQGVAISLFIKKPGLKKGVWHADSWGKQIEKYRRCAASDIRSTDWKKLEVSAPFYLFVPRDERQLDKYQKGYFLPEIFVDFVTGIVTARDKLVIAPEKTELIQRINEFVDPEIADDEIRKRFGLKDTRSWTLPNARSRLRESDWRKDIAQLLHRPFDVQRLLYRRDMVDWGRWDRIRHMQQDNVALSTIRSLDIQGEWAHVLAVDSLITHHTVSMKEVNYLFPLYLYPPAEGQKPIKTNLFDADDPFEGKDRIENLAPTFRQWINARFGNAYAPEEILGFIYAVLHAPSYRTRFHDFLRMDFPRIPFPQSCKEFEALSVLGWDLLQKHLMRDLPDSKLGQYKGKGDHTVEKPRYSEAEQAVYINGSQRFAPVPPEVWEFHIGGYQVIDKYLKSRKGRTLGLDEINQVERIANVLSFTIKQMEKIDAAYCKAFD